MKQIIAVLLFTFSTLALLGQTAPQQCPIAIEHQKIWAVVPGFDSTGTYVSNAVQARWKNISDKEIVGVKFNVAFPDITGDPVNSEQYGDGVKTKPGQKRHDMWDRAGYIGPYKIWVQKVMFSDGLKWEDDGSQSCYAQVTTK